MMTSSNGNIFRVNGPLCGEFTGPRRIPRTKASDAELWCFLWSTPWINGWVNNREAGDFGHHRSHYDVIVMSETLGIYQGYMVIVIDKFSMYQLGAPFGYNDSHGLQSLKLYCNIPDKFKAMKLMLKSPCRLELWQTDGSNDANQIWERFGKSKHTYGDCGEI